MTDRATRAAKFIAQSGWARSSITLLAGDASNRRYDRLKLPSGATAVLMDAPPDRGEDVRPFVRIAKYLRDAGLSAPEVFNQDLEAGFLLIEDLGDGLFARLMANDPRVENQLYRAATDVLIDLHATPPVDLPLCDATWLTDMTAPAFEWYSGGDADQHIKRFRDIFHPLAKSLDAVAKVVILRDYHAENLLWLPERTGTAMTGLLDFQDALLGHPAYDLVSILQDARRDVAPQTETDMIAYYLANTGKDEAAFQTAYALLGAQRNLRILGIFARLCLRDGKAHYVDFIPRVWAYLMRNLAHPTLTQLAAFINEALPEPTLEHLERLKSRCATVPQP